VRLWFPVTYSLTGTAGDTLAEHRGHRPTPSVARAAVAARKAMRDHLKKASKRLRYLLQHRTSNARPARAIFDRIESASTPLVIPAFAGMTGWEMFHLIG